jgi:hypothetical protein
MLDQDPLEAQATAAERQVLAALASPYHIQSFLDTLTYSADPFYRCPLRALREHAANCFDGAVLGAALLARLGHPPLIMELLPNERDDDHLLAVYREGGCWGAVAQSNFVGLRLREPLYRSLRELAMSYFEQYFNALGEKTLRAYRRPLCLRAFGGEHWLVRDEALEHIASRLDDLRSVPLLTAGQAARLAPVDAESLRAGLAGAVAAGLWRAPAGDA